MHPRLDEVVLAAGSEAAGPPCSTSGAPATSPIPKRHPLPASSAHAPVPVAYVLVPPVASAKALATEFARYLGIPVTARMTQAQITDAVCHTYNRGGVRWS